MNIDQLNEALPIVAIVIGWIAFGLVCSYSIPQLVKVLRTKDTSSLSILGYSFFIFSNFGMLCWGVGNAIRTQETTPIVLVLLSLIPNILLNIINLSINITCLSLKINHVIRAKKLKIDEKALSQIIFEKAKNKKIGED